MSRWLTLFTLILAGEMVFGLPFNTARFFRPTLLEAFNFTNTQLGDLFAVYGITAMLCYFPGGALADRFQARTLLSLSLVATACGGFVMMSFPQAETMALLYAFWGITSVLLLWGALIRATREWGGARQQGQAFGLLEAGRGIMAAAVAFVALKVFAWSLAGDVIDDSNRLAAFRNVILVYTFVTLTVAAMAWFFIPTSDGSTSSRPSPLLGMRRVVGRPVIWAQAGIIIAAYCGYKSVDNYSLYAVQVLGFDELEAAELSAIGAYIRPAGALAAGFFADRFSALRSVGIAFVLMLIAYVALSVATPDSAGLTLIFINLFISYFAVCGLRGVYFALLEENETPKQITGAAVGMISLIGFTPEIFFHPITGRILDADPGVVGHQNYFLFMVGVAVMGLSATLLLTWLRRRGGLWTQEIRHGAGRPAGKLETE